jgi:polar amino acid transport system substrate-binding protein
MFKYLRSISSVLLCLFFCMARADVIATTTSNNAITVYTEIDPAVQKNHIMLTNGLKILDHAGISSDVLTMPWNRAYNLASKRSNSIIFPIYKIPNRVKKFHWLCPIAPSRNIYLFRLAARDDLHISALQQPNDKIIGVVKDTMLHQFLMTNSLNFNFSLDATVHNKTNINKLLKGRLDYIAQSEEQLVSHFDLNNLDHSLIEKEQLIYDYTKYPMCAAIQLDTSPQIIKKLKLSYQVLFGQHKFIPKPIKNGFKTCH